MIRVVKSQAKPTVLTGRGARHRQKLEKLYDPATCHVPGNTLLHSTDGIYNDANVKEQLRREQHGKCCYCESTFTATSYGDVEHFRPKAGYQQTWQGPLHKPGYYWLAYDWDNLFFSCQRCNQEYKGNYFPLANHATARAHSHHDDTKQEQPLLLDPAQDDPAQHLTFVEDAIQALDERGRASIQGYGLDRPDLVKERADHLKGLQHVRMLDAFTFELPLSSREEEFLQELNLTVEQGKAAAEEARQIWREAAFDTAKFAGMVRAKFPHKLTR